MSLPPLLRAAGLLPVPALGQVACLRSALSATAAPAHVPACPPLLRSECALTFLPSLPALPVTLCRRKDAAAKGRADAKLQYVVISEKWDK